MTANRDLSRSRFTMSRKTSLLWIHKTARSSSLSHSEDQERITVFSQAQRTSRSQKSKHVRQKVTRKLSIRASLTAYPTSTHRERRSLEFFLDQTVYKIITLQRDKAFWTATVPYLAAHNEAMRHLVVAIAATHELLYHSDAHGLHIYALTESIKATKLLRDSNHWSPALLVASCILISALSLLRCDHAQAERSIESGLKISALPTNTYASEKRSSKADEFRYILESLYNSHGYKLWASDITFQFEKSEARQNWLMVDIKHIQGPFLNINQVIEAFKSIMLDVVAKLMRNLARGALIDRHSSLAQDVTQELAKLVFYWQQMYDSLALEDSKSRMDMEQVRIGIAHAFLVFHTKVVGPGEVWYEAYPDVCSEVLRLADRLVAARLSGSCLVYIDKFVNGSLFGLGLSSRDSQVRRRAIQLLQSQANFEDGLVNWLRGTVIDLISRTQCQLADPGARFILAGLDCTSKPRNISVKYRLPLMDAIVHVASFPVDWEPWFRATVTPKEVDDVLQGMMAAYRLYGKPHPSQAPCGYSSTMYYRGRPVPVYWDSEELEKLASAHKL